jgi:UTP--glucose-1-phosphate uridylyltransferase
VTTSDARRRRVVDPAAPTKALIPCGGRGTRMRPIVGDAPKELVPVAGVPAIEWVLRECAASGIDEVLIVSAPGKAALDLHVLSLAGAAECPGSIRVVVQQTPRGLADAIRLGRSFASGAPLAVALPDNLFVGAEPALAQVIDSAARLATNVVAVTEIAAADAAARGPTAALVGTTDGVDYRIARIPDKGEKGTTFDPGTAASAFTAVGRYVFQPDAVDAIDRIEAALAPGAELDDVPLMQHLLAEQRLVGRAIEGRFLDVGLPSGYADATSWLASRPPAADPGPGGPRRARHGR